MLISAAGQGASRLHAMAAAAALLVVLGMPQPGLLAQGLDAEGAIDTIVGSEVTTGEEQAADDEQRILEAIDNTAANVSEVRRRFSLDAVEIVFLPDLAQASGTAVDAALEENREAITELQQAIEGSAMFYHAVDSRRIMLRDVIALEFDDANGVTIFAKGTDPARNNPG